MEIKDLITIFAVLISPFLAVQAEKFIEKVRNNKSRKIQVFKTLMATRGSRLSYEHVTALNQIDLEFFGDDKYTRTLDAWKEYFDQLNTPHNSDTFNAWNTKMDELFVDLLHEMGKALDFHFNKVTIKRNIYAPSGHAKVENEKQEIRELLIKVLNGENAVTTFSIMPDELVEANAKAVEKTAELQSIMIENYKNGTPINVKIIKE